jgi:DNA helicase IV
LENWKKVKYRVQLDEWLNGKIHVHESPSVKVHWSKLKFNGENFRDEILRENFGEEIFKRKLFEKER